MTPTSVEHRKATTIEAPEQTSEKLETVAAKSTPKPIATAAPIKPPIRQTRMASVKSGFVGSTLVAALTLFGTSLPPP